MPNEQPTSVKERHPDVVRLIWHFYEQFLKPAEPPDRLYHYTSGAALLGIIGSRSLHLSDIRYLNDTSEFSYTFRLLQEHLDQMSQTDPAAKSFVESMRYTARFVSETHRFYVGCFSEERDQLSQWRGYAGPTGYSVGFSTSALHEAAARDPESFIELAPCIYDESAQRDLLKNALEYLSSETRVLLARGDRKGFDVRVEVGTAAAVIISALAARFKHHAFHEEKEWRLVLRPSLASEKKKPILFRAGTRFLIPYVELSLKEHPTYALESLTVGPTPHPVEALESARQLFATTLGLEEKDRVVLSSLPFRDW